MPVIRSNLKEVMKQYDPKLSIRKLAKDVDYHFDSIRRMYKDEMVQYPRDLLLKLCIYFNIQPAQLIVMEDDGYRDCAIDESDGYQGESNERKTTRN
ncbi:helix-turn-helix transcriptional regulator [Paenibacillus sp. EPM92]|uniref:helix-turn-helix domain-containing protein n=1 Tax=Paenibacillus sp. EPM92 TaxID=1561195 RepID=UPI00191534D5|nr:helix-turn-helix transcriptional regulator [Paenibacillus sp. EPM92]